MAFFSLSARYCCWLLCICGLFLMGFGLFFWYSPICVQHIMNIHSFKMTEKSTLYCVFVLYLWLCSYIFCCRSLLVWLFIRSLALCLSVQTLHLFSCNPLLLFKMHVTAPNSYRICLFIWCEFFSLSLSRWCPGSMCVIHIFSLIYTKRPAAAAVSLALYEIVTK